LLGWVHVTPQRIALQEGLAARILPRSLAAVIIVQARARFPSFACPGGDWASPLGKRGLPSPVSSCANLQHAVICPKGALPCTAFLPLLRRKFMPKKTPAKPAAKPKAKPKAKGATKAKVSDKPAAPAKATAPQPRVEDLRAEERFPERIPVALHVKTGNSHEEHGGTTIDISIFGLQVETHAKLDPGQHVHIPTFGDCVVVWVRAVGPGKPYQAGLKMVR
jgi:hypothetical protein